MPETSPPSASQGQPQQAPFGSSPATGPTPNRGFEAAGLQKMGMVAKMLEDILSTSGSSSEVGKVALECLNKVVKLVPAGSVSPAAQKNNLDQMQMKNAQSNQAMQQLRQQSQPQGGGAGGPPQQAAA